MYRGRGTFEERSACRFENFRLLNSDRSGLYFKNADHENRTDFSIIIALIIAH